MAKYLKQSLAVMIVFLLAVTCFIVNRQVDFNKNALVISEQLKNEQLSDVVERRSEGHLPHNADRSISERPIKEEHDLGNSMEEENLQDVSVLYCDEATNGQEIVKGNFSIKVTVDKTEVRIGDRITATVVFKNLSNEDIPIEIVDWKVLHGNLDILSAVFVPLNSILGYEAVKVLELPKDIIKANAVIEREYEYIVNELNEFEFRAGAYFFICNKTDNPVFGEQINSNPIKYLAKM